MADSSTASPDAERDPLAAPRRTPTSLPGRDPYWQPFGARFRGDRERLGLTLEDVSLLTKIHPRFLKAIENGDFHQLPGGILSKSFLRAYAESIGMDRQTIAHCLEASGLVRPAPPASEEPDRPPIRIPATHTRSAFSLVASGLILGLMMLIYYQGDFLVGQLARWADKVAKAQGTSNYPGVAANDAPRTASLGPADATRSVAPVSRLASMEYPVGTFYIEIAAREDAWVSINADGTVVMQSMLTAPAQKLIVARRRVVIRAGNIGAIDFHFNGHPLPPQGEYNQAKTLVFGMEGLEIDFSRKTVAAQIE